MTPNELLLWLSARTKGSWLQFRGAVENLELVHPDEEEQGAAFPIHQRIRFNLERLGHVEFDTVGCENGWRVVPPTLALSASKLGAIGVLCGARTSNRIVDLQQKVNDLSIDSVSYPDCPDIVRMSASSASPLIAFAECNQLAWQEDAPAALLSRIPSVGVLRLWRRDSLPSAGKDWDVRQFVCKRKTATWRTISLGEANAPAAQGLFCFTRFQTPQYFLREGSDTIRLPGAVGKYWLLAQRRRRVLKYDRNAMTLTVPAIFRPPLLTERALILCSGFPPSHNVVYDRPTLTYQNIPEEIAGMISEVLGQDLS